MLIHEYFTSAEYAELSPRAVKLLIDLYCQFRGVNNGDFCATFKVMKQRGWSSNDQLHKALHELLDAGWIVVTRQGGRRVCSLYAVTFLPIDECSGKLDINPTRLPSHSWKRRIQAPTGGNVTASSLSRHAA